MIYFRYKLRNSHQFRQSTQTQTSADKLHVMCVEWRFWRQTAIKHVGDSHYKKIYFLLC